MNIKYALLSYLLAFSTAMHCQNAQNVTKLEQSQSDETKNDAKMSGISTTEKVLIGATAAGTIIVVACFLPDSVRNTVKEFTTNAIETGWIEIKMLPEKAMICVVFLGAEKAVQRVMG